MRKKTLLVGLLGGAALVLFLACLSENQKKPEKSMIKSIGITERGSYVPEYKSLEIKNDRTVIYESGTYAPKKIERNITGKIDKGELEGIIEILYEKDFFSMNGKYYNNPKIYDASTTKILVQVDGKEYSVSEYDAAGPQKLHDISQEIWRIKEKIKMGENK